MGHLIFSEDIKEQLSSLRYTSPAAKAIMQLRGEGADPDELLGEAIVYYEAIKKNQDEQLFKYISKYGTL